MNETVRLRELPNGLADATDFGMGLKAASVAALGCVGAELAPTV